MGTIYCTGGHSFSDAEVPSPHARTLISDATTEAVIEEVVAMIKRGDSVEAIDDRWGFLLKSKGTPAYQCPECGRLLVFEKGLDKPATSYRRE